MAAYATAADDGDAGGAQSVETGGRQEGPVPRELLEDERFIVVAVTGTGGERVVRVQRGRGWREDGIVGAAVFDELRGLW